MMFCMWGVFRERGQGREGELFLGQGFVGTLKCMSAFVRLYYFICISSWGYCLSMTDDNIIKTTLRIEHRFLRTPICLYFWDLKARSKKQIQVQMWFFSLVWSRQHRKTDHAAPVIGGYRSVVSKSSKISLTGCRALGSVELARVPPGHVLGTRSTSVPATGGRGPGRR